MCHVELYTFYLTFTAREAGDLAKVELQAIHGGEWTILSYIFLDHNLRSYGTRIGIYYILYLRSFYLRVTIRGEVCMYYYVIYMYTYGIVTFP
jgi:hypothetical protein